MKTVKTTNIKKKYKDKQTGEWKSLTIKHAMVKDRLKEFREENTRGDIVTEPMTINGDLVFKAFIIKDKSDLASASATGHVSSASKKGKSFEALETLAVGRALALLGYGTDGGIASSEEMERFHEYENEKKEEAILSMRAVKTIDELKEVFMSLGNLMADPEVIAIKDQLKLKLTS